MFDGHFEAILADTEDARRIHYQIRYQVYCLENQFEDLHRYPDHEEHDEWDDRAIHFLVRSRATKEWVGAVRLILPTTNGLPIQQICSLSSPPDSPIGELSRLCVVERYRRRIPSMAKVCGLDSASRDTPLSTHSGPIILLGLLRAAARYSLDSGIMSCYLLTTPGIARLLNRWNIELQQAGDRCNHRGERYPYLANLQRGYELARRCSSSLAQMLTRESAYRRYSELGFRPHRTEAVAQVG